MSDAADLDLLTQFARDGSEAAFAALVQRHIALVYSVALRGTQNPQNAQDITQAVFIILARKAGALNPKTVLPGWLYQTARLTAANWQRAELRRLRREQEACMQSDLMEPGPDKLWRELSPLLDDAMARLNTSDRDALVLRYFQNRSLAEVGTSLGIEERAAQKRIARALEKLKKIFARRGVVLTTAIIAGAVSTNSVQAAPGALTKTVTTVAISKGSIAAVPILTLVKGSMKLMTWLKIKTAIAVGAAVVLATGTVVVATRVAAQALGGSSAVDDSAWNRMDSRALAALPPAFVLRPTHFAGGGGGMVTAGDQILGRAISFDTLMGVAYGVDGSKIISPADKPAGRYDLLVTDPKMTAEQLQKKIRQQLGYAAHVEQRETDVLRLALKQAGAPGLRVSGAANSGSSHSSAMSRNGTSTRNINLVNASIPSLVMNLQGYFDKPILDHTGLTEKYDVNLEVVSNSGESESGAIADALAKQLGLNLTPAHENVDMLVVEKTR